MADNLPEPKSRKESYLAKAAGMSVTIPEVPESRTEQYLAAIAEGGGGGGGTTYTAGDNIQISADNVISATDTTYSNFVGTDGVDAGTAGLVPAPATTDAGKYLKADGTWGTVNAGPTVVQTTGTSTTDVMSQNAVTDTLYADPSNKRKLALTTSSNRTNAGSYSTSLGTNSLSWGNSSVAIGNSADVRGSNAVGIGEASLVGSSMAGSQYAIAIGSNPMVNGTAAIGIGHDAQTSGVYSVVIGDATRGNASGYGVAIGKGATVESYSPSAIALGAWSSASGQGVMSINLTGTGAGLGYNNSDYRLLTGVYDGQSAHDAATYGQLNTRLGGLTLLTISQTDYDNLGTKDPDTLYVITGA